MKKCSMCGTIQTPKNSWTRGKYLSSYCKKCQVEFMRQYKKKNVLKMRGYWNKQNRKRAMIKIPIIGTIDSKTGIIDLKTKTL